MLTKHKISADFYDDEFKLIAIHSGLADYAITYAINDDCGLRLKRMTNDLQIGANTSFSMFDWEDKYSDTYWTLISNKCEMEEVISSEGLFTSSTSVKKNYLIEERKEVDYFLKVDAVDEYILYQQVKKINKIANVVTAYPVEIRSLKSKRNLIF
ncbi:IPExxxVDY family protein [Muricauda sp. JGD-17]|uniref:IPExxxVDY family protein n=1 Tax=Flagellimonas ochracea TaxID=2696472 RepID=A0A964TCT8_9FLAO|nr:IPExxxVDY family protein [Allomuricauda ochracea]NAY91806.1 IPExxxVDY family protein [Allomuricauda ochracea]